MEKECRKRKSKMSFLPGPWFFKPQDRPQVKDREQSPPRASLGNAGSKGIFKTKS